MEQSRIHIAVQIFIAERKRYPSSVNFVVDSMSFVHNKYKSQMLLGRYCITLSPNY